MEENYGKAKRYGCISICFGTFARSFLATFCFCNGYDRFTAPRVVEASVQIKEVVTIYEME